MDNLYTFNNRSWHCRLFHKIWNIWPDEKFNTMCPYFWALIGTLAISPLILIIALFVLFFKSKKLSDVMITLKERCEAYNDARRARKGARLKAKVIAIAEANKQLFLDYIEAVRMKDDEKRQKLAWQLRRLQIGAGANFDHYWESLSFADKLMVGKWGDSLLSNLGYYATNHYDFVIAPAKRKRKDARKKSVIDSIPFKILSVILVGITIIMGLTIVGLIGWGIYLIVPPIVIWFIREGWIVLAGLIGGIAAVLLIMYAWSCWKDAVGNALYFLIVRPIVWLSQYIRLIVWFQMLFGMIHAIYKNYCPMITWKGDE